MSNEEEVNWETLELERWIVNECPDLYFYWAARRGAKMLQFAVEESGLLKASGIYGESSKNPEPIDWGYLARELG